PAPPPVLARPRALTGRRVLLVDFPGSTQTYFWIGNVGVDRRYPRRAALDLVNTLFGGRFTSLLNTELRIKSGLSYGARSSFARGSVPGEFSLRSFAQTENTGRALDLALRTLERLRQEGVSREMLDSARAYTLGQYPLGLETAADWAEMLGEIELYGLGKGYIDDYAAQVAAVGVAEAQAVIEEAFPHADSVAVVAIGDAARIRGALGEYGSVRQIALTDPEFAAAPTR
ncbi:MAG: insulinase family protein, partial [Steroidobacteraceae bacterium]